MTSERPLVSIIVPYHNASETLEITLDSIFASSYPNFEVIAVDDRSEDDCPEIALHYDCIHISTLRASGAAIARNLGAKAASGEIFFFLDADVPNLV